MKRYFDHTKEEKLTLSHDDFHASVKIEAIERGIKPPITLDNILKQQPFMGFNLPPDTAFFYEIMVPGQFRDGTPTGLAFKTIEEARAAMTNAVAIHEEGCGADKRQKICYGEFSVREVYITLTKSKTFACAVEELTSGEDELEFNKLCEECSNDLQTLRQEDYNREVTERKRAEYLSLAGGDEEIAKRFWAKTERAEFPTAA